MGHASPRPGLSLCGTCPISCGHRKPLGKTPSRQAGDISYERNRWVAKALSLLISILCIPGFGRGELCFYIDDSAMQWRNQIQQDYLQAVDWLPVIFLNVFFYFWKQTTVNHKSKEVAFKLAIFIQIDLEPCPTSHLFSFWCTFSVGHWPEQNSGNDKYSFIPRHSNLYWNGSQHL